MPIGQALEEVRIVGVDAKVAELHLRLCPCQGRRPFEGRRIAILVGQVDDRLAGLGDDRCEDAWAVVARARA